MPVDSGVSDLWHGQTRLVTDDIEGVYQSLARAGAHFVSPGVVKLPDDGLGFRKGLTVRGLDGHALQIVQKSF